MNEQLKAKFLAFHEENKRAFEARRAFEDDAEELGVSVCDSTYNSSAKESHIYRGISFLADALGLSLERGYHSEKYPYRYSFTHDGWKYFQINQADETLGTAEAAPADTETVSNE